MEEFGGDNFFVKNWVDETFSCTNIASGKHFLLFTFFGPLCFVKTGPDFVSSAILYLSKTSKNFLCTWLFSDKNLHNFYIPN